MPAPEECDVAVVGGGIVGLATARELLARRRDLRVVVLEREPEVGQGQTGRNSGVIHAGIYYEPGSLKARLCVEGARRMYEYCATHGIEAERCGKLIVAADESELPGLDELERRGRANEVPGLRRLGPDELREIEPAARGVAALHSPNTGIVDFGAVARALARDVEAAGGDVVTDAGVQRIQPLRGSMRGSGSARGGASGASAGVELTHPQGTTRGRLAVFCAGAQADRLAIADGADPDPRIVPFRGAYFRLRRERAQIVRGLIYPVPDARLPFLGVHLTRHPGGEVLIGPTALLALRRRSLAWPGTWRMMRRFWRAGAAEISHAVSRRALVAAARRLVPELESRDVEPAFAGYRAQAVSRDGRLVDDFVFSDTPSGVHVRNAPSPAATSALAIASLIADRAEPRLPG